jgi:hypothetical protein
MESMSTTELFQVVISNQVIMMEALLKGGFINEEDAPAIRAAINHNVTLLIPTLVKLQEQLKETKGPRS